ncbi:IgA FC receptor [Frondihabitans sp. 762G35]|nr:IgA FC receptor [Frondihabitans sp. 762G35]
MWWARRRMSRGTAVPYAVGRYREAWLSFPVLVRQYHPEFNGGIVLSQIPPAADVFLTWQCDVGHVFVATPGEQRSRPGRERRRSSWCPDCAELAKPRTPRLVSPPLITDTPRDVPAGPQLMPAPPLPPPPSPPASAAAARAPQKPRARRIPKPLCPVTPQLPAGTPFASACAPPPASAVEADLRARLVETLEFTTGFTAVRLARPFFDHLEAWPDILLPELRVALEYDSTGRHGLEHVGRREEADRRKDRALRNAGWEVVRIRTGRLPALGPHDLQVSGVTKTTMAKIVDELRVIRGPLFVDAYLRG